MADKCALLWDESFLWGMMAYDALRGLGLGFDLVCAKDVQAGALKEYTAILVPGGWASNKIKALGNEGANAIREFVSSGGTYIGICGGAGLATSANGAGGLGLLEIQRKPLKDRVPSLAGPVRLSLNESRLWQDVDEPIFSLWWPSQFVLADESIKVLASFKSATPDAFSSDLPVEGMSSESWSKAEEAYGINLNPAKMHNDPVVVEGTYGKGTVIASLAHFDTPGCPNGRRVLKNLWKRFSLPRCRPARRNNAEPTGQLYGELAGLFDFGRRNFLWFERNTPNRPGNADNSGSMIQWRRGVRGLEYFTLYRMAAEVSTRATESDMADLIEPAQEFASLSSDLLAIEAAALRRGERITFAKANSAEMESLREKLFGKGKSHGGGFKKLLDSMDALLYERLKKKHYRGQEKEDATDTGLVHIYTGQGKGKTTASVGLALRAQSRNLRVMYAQFMKNLPGGETRLLREHGIEVRRYKEVRSPLFHPEADMDELRQHAMKALNELTPMLDDFDLVLADEFVTMVQSGLITEATALEFMAQKPDSVELVLTGRGATPALIDAADLVSEVCNIKHYNDSGVKARKGIEF